MRTPGKAVLGAVAVASVVAAGATGASSVSSVYRPQQQVCAEFADTVGLYPGNSVTMLGVDIGSVSDIEARGDRMRVRMKVADDIELPADVGAVTISSSIVTDRHVELTRSYVSGPRFDPTQCIPLERTKTPIGISEALDAVGALSADLTGGQAAAAGKPGDTLLDETLTAADRALAGTGPQWNILMARLSQLIGDRADRDVALRRLIDNLDQLITMFVANWPDMRALLDNLKDGIQMIGGVSDELSRAVDLAVQFIPVIARNVDKYDHQAYGFLDQAAPAITTFTRSAGDIADILLHVPVIANSLAALFDTSVGAARVDYRPPRVEATIGGKVVEIGLAQVLLGSAVPR
ncbi:MCE family protein [Nocardia sp. GCM10030253]|uniref:MCE family protein n=1 Tax=Nocardia sp. GCM10030253 TaxID=3273404 RepID=UPI0036281765